MDEGKVQFRHIYDFCALDLDGNNIKFDKFKGKVCLIVNVSFADDIDFQQTFDCLLQINKQYNNDVMLLLFPCFQFGNGMSKKQLATYSKYGDRGALFDSIEVNGLQTHELYRYLKAVNPGLGLSGGLIKHDLTTFLIDRNGFPRGRYLLHLQANALTDAIQELI